MHTFNIFEITEVPKALNFDVNTSKAFRIHHDVLHWDDGIRYDPYYQYPFFIPVFHSTPPMRPNPQEWPYRTEGGGRGHCIRLEYKMQSVSFK